jgi:glutathione S-transferase
MKIYWYETVNPRKVCSVAKQVGLVADYEHVDLSKGTHKQADFLGINPNGRVPALIDGDLQLWESAAICVYVAGKAGSSLWPLNDVRAQAEILKPISWHIAHAMPVLGPFYFEHYVKPLLGIGAPDEAKLAALMPQAHASARVLNTMLDGRRYLAGDRLSIADFINGALLPDWKAQAMPLDDYANIRRWLDGLLELDAFNSPWPR